VLRIVTQPMSRPLNESTAFQPDDDVRLADPPENRLSRTLDQLPPQRSEALVCSMRLGVIAAQVVQALVLPRMSVARTR
jgi:hypothetical protein